MSKFTAWRSAAIAILCLSFTVEALAAVHVSESTSTDGAYTVSWDNANARSYFVYESKNGGGSSQVANVPGLNRAFSGKSNGTYEYEILAEYCDFFCYTTSIGTATVTVSVIPAPSTPGAILAPSTANTGSYGVSWGESSGTVTQYQLQERANGGSWSTVYEGTAHQRSYTKSQNTYFDYRVRACNQNSCSSYTSHKRVTVPAANISASVTPNSLNRTDSTFTLTWSSTMTSGCSWNAGSISGTSGSKSFNLAGPSWSQDPIPGGYVWTKATQITCSVIGGGSLTRNVALIAESIQPQPNVTVNWNSGTGYVGESSTLTWSASEANSCTLDGGSVGTSGSRSFTYTSTGSKTKSVTCSNEMGATTQSKPITIVYRAPGVPSSLSLPSTDNDGSYTVSWGTASGALTEYQLQERANGGSWSTVYTGTSRSRNYSKSHNTFYDYRVRACNHTACGNYTSSKRVTMPAASVDATVSTMRTYGTDSVTIGWSSVMVSSCTWSGINASGKSGSVQEVLTGWAFNASNNRWEVPLSVSCNVIGGGTVSDSVTATATHREPKPTVSASWNESAVFMGQPATLTWSSGAADSCLIDGINVGLNGSRPYSFGSAATHTKTVICTNLGGSTSASANIEIEGVNVTFPDAVDPLDDLPSSGDTYYGNLGGNFSVSGGGSAAYSLAIQVPPGIRGVQPNISLNYSSDRGNGVAGWGWAISGQSRIHRCAASQLRDGYTSGTRDGDQYKFCLDGHRLVEVASNEYRTERESDRKITKDNAGFTVYLRNGRKLSYGKTSDARRPSQDGQSYIDWHLNRVEDQVGNYMTYHYEADANNGIHRLDRIEYTKNSAGSINHSVHFEYETREDTQSGYWSGVYYNHNERLDRIDVNAGGVLLRRYDLTYQAYNDSENADPAKTSRLKRIDLCYDSASSICSEPVEFEWTSRKQTDFGFTETQLVNANHTSFDDSWLLDFDGDGVREVLYNDKDYPSKHHGKLYLVEQGGTPTYGNDQQVADFSAFGPWATPDSIADINHDGRDDIVLGASYVAYATDSGFSDPERLDSSGDGRWSNIQFRDFNADGLVDMYLVPNTMYHVMEGSPYAEPAGRYQRIDIALNQGNGHFSDFIGRGTIAGGQPDTRKLADMNGDGLLDVVMCEYITYEWHYRHQDDSYCRFFVYLNNGEDSSGNLSFADRVNWVGAEVAATSWTKRNNADASPPPSEQLFQLADMNGDRLPDAVWIAQDDVQVAINTGESFLPFEVWLNQDVSPIGWLRIPASLADMNSDGYPDLVFSTDGGTCFGGGCVDGNVRIAYNVGGRGFSAPVTSSAISGGFFGEDLDDDGVMDISGQYEPPSLSPTGVRLGSRAYKNNWFHHRITGIVNNGGRDIALRYRALNDPTVHTQAGSDRHLNGLTSATGVNDGVHVHVEADMAVIRYATTTVATRHLVERVDIDDGIGGTNNTEYHYTGFLRHRDGWGGLGFEQVEATSTIGATGEQTRTVSEYSQEVGDNYKVAGLLKTRTHYASDKDGNLQQIARTQNHWYVHTLSDDIDTDGYNSPHYRIVSDENYSENNDLNGAFVTRTSSYKRAYSASAPTACRTTDFTDFITVETTAHSSIDTYGNTHQNISLSCDGTSTFTTVTKNQYENQASANHWVLGLVTNTQITNIAPDHNGTLQSVTREQSNTYAPLTGLLLTQTREPNNSDLTRTTTINSYDGYGTPTSITESWNNTNGLSVSSRNSTMSVSYQSDGTRTITATNALGQSTTSIVEGKFGQIRSVTDANLLTTSTTFDSLGRIDTITAPDTSSVVNRYRVCNTCEAPSTATRFYVHSKASGASAQRMYYDAYGRAVGQRVVGLTGLPSYTETTYDAAGRVATVSEPFFTGETRYTTTYEYDSLGRTESVIAPNMGETSTAYNGRQITVTNALEQNRTQWQNGIGQNTRTEDHYGTAITYVYAPFGNLARTEVIPSGDSAGVVTTMGYDLLGRQAYLDDPSAGRVDYTYNGLDLIHTSTDAKNQRTVFSYDALGRQITRVDNALAANPANRTHEWFYDTPNSGEGRLDSVVGFDTDGVAYSESYSYNAYGLPTLVETTIQGETFDTQTYYDDLNRPVGIEYPTGFTVVNHYNNYGYRHQVRNGMNDTLLWEATEADARGNITRSEHGNGVATTRGYQDDTGFVTSIHAMKQSNSLLVQNQEFGYDLLGNLTSRTDMRLLNGTGYTQAFCYDHLNRLTGIRTNSCTGTENDLTYDDLGNIQTRVMANNVTQTYHYADSANPYLLTGTNLAGTYGYDNNGNMTSGDGRTIQYSSFDKPTRMSKDGNTVDITYGSDQTRIRRVDNASTITTYVAGIYEKREEGSIITHLHHIGDIALHIWQEENQNIDMTTSYLHHDHIGSLVAKSNEVGDRVEWSASDPWGLRQDQSWLGGILGTDYVPTDTRDGFTGHEHMDGVGLIHMNGRVYDPNIGRFLTPDILIQAPDSSQSFNRYAYVFNNPLTNTDPTGYESGCGGMAGQKTSNCTFIGVPAEGSSVRTVDVVQDDEGNYYYEGVDGNFYSVDKLTEAGYELSFDGDGNLSGITGPSGGGAGSSASGGSPSSNATPGGNAGANRNKALTPEGGVNIPEASPYDEQVFVEGKPSGGYLEIALLPAVAYGGLTATEWLLVAAGVYAASQTDPGKEATNALITGVTEKVSSGGPNDPENNDNRGTNEQALTNKQADKILRQNGYNPVKGLRSQGQQVYRNPKGNPKYLVKSNTSHSGDAFKGFNSEKAVRLGRGQRAGSYDAKLMRVGD